MDESACQPIVDRRQASAISNAKKKAPNERLAWQTSHKQNNAHITPRVWQQQNDDDDKQHTWTGNEQETSSGSANPEQRHQWERSQQHQNGLVQQYGTKNEASGIA